LSPSYDALRARYREAMGRDRALASRIVRAYGAKARRAGDAARLAEALLLGAEVASEGGRLAAASSRYARALAGFRRLGDRRGEFRVAVSAVQTFARRGDRRQTLRLARLLRRHRGSREERAYAALACGSALSTLGDERAAEASFRAACALAGRPALRAAAEVHLGVCLARRGRAREAVRRFDAALAAYEESGQGLLAAVARHNRGWAAGIAGDLVTAFEDLRAASSAFAAGGDRRRAALARLDEGELLLRLGDSGGAAGAGADAARDLSRLGAHPEAARALLVVARARGGGAAARKALALFRRGGDRAGAAAASVLLHEGVGSAERALFRAGHLLDALDALLRHARSLPPATGARLMEGRIRAYPAALRRWVEPDLHALRAEAGDGIPMLRRAVRAAESIRARIPRVALRAGLLARHLQCYEALARALLARGGARDRREAFLVLDAARARTLRDEMEREAPAIGEAAAVRACRLRLEELWRAAEQAQRQSSDLRSGAPALRREIVAAERDLVSALRRAGGGVARLPAELPRGTCLALATLDGDVHGLLSCDGEVSVWNCGPLARLREEVDAFAFQVARRLHGPGDVAAAGAALDAIDRRLAAGAPPLPPGPLKIVLPPELGSIPFEALSFCAGRPLAHAPSLAERPVARRRGGALLVGIDDGRLPEVRREIAAIARRLPGAQRLEGAAATRDAVLGSIGRTGLVHLAGHAQAREDVPPLSALRASDGWIAAADLAAAPLEGGLFVLSACRTGDPSLRWQGEALGGFPRALLAAGAGAIVASRWEVRDEVARAWMREFYRALARSGPMEALAGARAAVRRAYPHPAEWAAFLLITGRVFR